MLPAPDLLIGGAKLAHFTPLSGAAQQLPVMAPSE